MNRTRLLLIAAALIAAGLAAYLAQGFMRQAEAPPSPQVEVGPPPTVDVVVAAKDLAPGEKLSGFAVEWRAWPRDFIHPQMITKDAKPDALESLQEARARLSMVPGEPIIETKVVKPGERGFMSAVLPKGMRAISIGISEGSAASGFILPNDRVDVLVTRGGTEAEAVLTNVRVLAINQTLNKGDEASLPGGRTAVLQLTPRQAAIIAQIQSSGGVSLVLRSLAEDGDGGIKDEIPQLSESYTKPRRALNDTLVIRSGREVAVPNR